MLDKQAIATHKECSQTTKYTKSHVNVNDDDVDVTSSSLIPKDDWIQLIETWDFLISSEAFFQEAKFSDF